MSNTTCLGSSGPSAAARQAAALGGEASWSNSDIDVRATAAASSSALQNSQGAGEGGDRVIAFRFESSTRDQGLTTAKQDEFKADFCRQVTRLEKWAADQRWAPVISPDLQVVVSDTYKISKSLVPAWHGHHGRMEFPAWRVILRRAAIVHELVHVFFPNGNRFLAEGLAVYLQAEIGENPAFPNFGRPLHALVRELLPGTVPALAHEARPGLEKIRLVELDAISTPNPLTLKVGQDFYGEEPRGQARIYPIVGSFAQFLIESRGMERFRALYWQTPLIPLAQSAGSPDRWQGVYGGSLADLEDEWKSLITSAAIP